ncbi:hypothetical protein BDR05DRAFT_889671 [Suillus weaverae]|nr:hypothetical protein BDR05DRAFT_889671 [Suillus weaverae]
MVIIFIYLTTLLVFKFISQTSEHLVKLFLNNLLCIGVNSSSYSTHSFHYRECQYSHIEYEHHWLFC